MKENAMPSSDLGEARRLLEQAERETNPARKFAALEEGIDLLETYAAESEVPDLERSRSSNLRHSHIRRLLKQLIELRGIQFDVWFDYIKLLLLRLEPDVKAILEEDASLKDGYSKFTSLWKDELLEALQRST